MQFNIYLNTKINFPANFNNYYETNNITIKHFLPCH